jgi:hypothetical protein
MINFEPYTAPYKNQLFGKPYTFFTEKSVYVNFLKQVMEFKLGVNYYNCLNLIFRSRFWETHGFDAKTFVKDNYQGNISSFFHDYPSRCGFGGKKNDIIFLYLELKSGAGVKWAFTQYYVVRVAAQLFILRDYIKGQRVPEPQWLKDLYDETIVKLKREYKIKSWKLLI